MPPPAPVAIGVDLAWGLRGHTGLAAVTIEGDLVALDTVRTDDQIKQWLGVNAPGPCVVAFDAPLIVRNATGMRDCERAVSARFGARNASCYPSNLANRNFTDGGRAWSLSVQLDLDTRWENAGQRRAIEVYPHAALVSLFDLPTVLRYKRGRGRTLETRRAEMVRLIRLVESLVSAEPALSVDGSKAWAAASTSVGNATRPMHLNAVEDAIDAVVCAYVALLAHRAPTSLEAFGSQLDGAIWVPIGPSSSPPVRGRRGLCASTMAPLATDRRESPRRTDQHR